jgi:hypothetical protein
MGWNGGQRHAERHGKQVHGGKKAAGSRKRKTAQPSSAYPDPEQQPESSGPARVRTGIVSVNGQDVGVMHCRPS